MMSLDGKQPLIANLEEKDMSRIMIVNPHWEEGREEAQSVAMRLATMTDAELVFVSNAARARAALLTERYSAVLMNGDLGHERTGAELIAYLRVRGVDHLPICMISSDHHLNADGIRCGANASCHKRMLGDRNGPLADFLERAGIRGKP